MAKERSFIRRFYFTANLLLWIIFLAVLVIAFTPMTRYMLRPLIMKDDIRKADAIVVLGGGLEKGRYLTFESAHRLIRGAQLYYEGKAPKMILSGGVSPKAGVAEGAVLAQEARRLNIPSDDLLIEAKSRRTYEQSMEIKKIAEPLRWKSLLLVTSHVHMKRAVLAFESAGFKVYPAPADPLEKYADGPLDRLDLFGKITHEYGGMVYYWFKGWI